MCRGALQSRIQPSRSHEAETYPTRRDPWVHKTSWPLPPGSPASVYEKSREQRGGKGRENVTACRHWDSSQRDPVGVARLCERD